MDAITILNASGNRVNPSRVRIEHQQQVLDTTTVLSILVAPLNKDGLSYPVALIRESPPVRCFIYDWLQYVNFSLQRQFGNIITSKEEQLKTAAAFDVFPNRQAEFTRVTDASWEPVYTDQPAQTGELYLLLDRLLNLKPVEFEDEDLVSSVRITAAGDVRVTASGDRRIAILADSPEIPVNLPEAA